MSIAQQSGDSTIGSVCVLAHVRGYVCVVAIVIIIDVLIIILIVILIVIILIVALDVVLVVVLIVLAVITGSITVDIGAGNVGVLNTTTTTTNTGRGLCDGPMVAHLVNMVVIVGIDTGNTVMDHTVGVGQSCHFIDQVHSS